MPRTLSATEAQSLIAGGDVEVIDVREPNEYAAGHVPGARSLPLAELRGDPRGKLHGERMLFVCAKGVRSLTAAKLAEEIGVREVYSLEGGTSAWASAGLPIERPEPPATAGTPAPEPEESSSSNCGLPAPSLDAIVGTNLHALRTAKNVSLDALARDTGLSRALLGQIEIGRASPSVSVVWRIAQAFDVPFSALLASAGRPATSVVRATDARRLVSPDGRFSSRALYPLDHETDAEFYELFFAAHSREDAAAHRPGTKENLVVTSGRLELELGGERFELGKGDAITFIADVPHSYVNPGNDDCWVYLVMTYAR